MTDLQLEKVVKHYRERVLGGYVCGAGEVEYREGYLGGGTKGFADHGASEDFLFYYFTAAPT